MIGQTVSDILTFECFGAHFRRPSWILRQTGSGLFFSWFLMMARSYGENFVTIGQTVFKILRFSFCGSYFRRPSWILVEPKLDGVWLCLMMAWSFCENFVTIGQTVSDILRFEYFAAHFRPPSWIFHQTGTRLGFSGLQWWYEAAMKISWRSVKRSLRYCDFRFQYLFPAAILDFGPNRN